MNNKFDLLKLDNQLCFPLYAASREMVRRYHPFLSPLGLTYTQYVTMMVLWETDKVSVKKIGKKLHLDSGTLTPLLKELEKKGYITRARSKEDERVTIVELTDKGHDLKEMAVEIPLKMSKCINLSSEEVSVLYRILYKIIDNS